MPKPNLKTVLYANTVFSTVCGFLMLMFAGWISSQALEFPSVVFVVMGAGLLAFAAAVFYIAVKLPGTAKLAKLVFWADVGWVVATPVAMIVLADNLTPLGNWMLIDIAVMVGVLALLEWRAMKGGDEISGEVVGA